MTTQLTESGTAAVDAGTVRAIDDADRLTKLFEQLGYEPQAVEIPLETLPAWGLGEPATAGIDRMRLVARHGSLVVLLLELAPPAVPGRVTAVMAARFRRAPAARELVVFASPGFLELTFCVRVLGQDSLRTRRLVVRRRHPHASDLEALSELRVLSPDEPATELAFRIEESLDRERVTDAFFVAFRRTLDTFCAHLRHLPDRLPEREGIARRFCLLVLNRLLFMYFIQKKGWLNRDRAFLPALFARTRAAGRPFNDTLKVLFFEVLNTPEEARTPAAAALGRFPYLNGGLFEPDSVERAHPQLTILDPAFEAAFSQLLEKFRFTVREDPETEQDTGVDPEMLGRVFENLMDAEERGETGSFYTPREAVAAMAREALSQHLTHRAGLSARDADRLTDERDAGHLDPATATAALDGLETIRVLDPAVGSGAFLLGMLGELTGAQQALRKRLGLPAEPAWRLKRRIIHRNLYGVDLNGSAVKLCCLRLWLALAVDLVEDDVRRVPPLPNLDHKVKQGDSLLAPLDLVDPSSAAAFHGRLRERLGELPALKDRYERSSGPAKRQAAAALEARERELALELVDFRLRVAEEQLEGLEAQSKSLDLFGRPQRLDAAAGRALDAGRAARRQLLRLRRRLVEGGELPSFGFEVHFAEALAEGGFDIVIGNPPWVRLKDIPQAVRPALRARYSAFREACWRAGAELGGAGAGLGGQIDLSILFLERSMELCRSGGIVSLMLPSKLFSALYAGGIRRRLVDGWSLTSLADYSASRRRLFRADTFPAIVTARKHPAGPDHQVACRIEAGAGESRRFRLPQRRLPALEADGAAPWVAAPAAVRDALARMRAAGAPLGTSLRPSMGHKTGANSVFVVESCELAVAGARIFSRGFSRTPTGQTPSAYIAVVERHAVRPLLRGDGIRPWRARCPEGVLWRTAGSNGRRLGRYLKRHGMGAGRPDGRDFAGPMVVWKDIARSSTAVFVDAPLLGPAGPGWPVPLNTTSYVAVSDSTVGHALAALLNSAPARAYLASLAPRAKDGYCRFLCWTVGMLPLPALARRGRWTGELAELSRRLHETEGQDRKAATKLDRVAARFYGLSSSQLAALEDWLAFATGARGAR
ncbi:MAG: hypothetical protein HY816_01555 [Candidatus Wallbacteria bacterium]|nr:hypothetical protein [Candidatus Wallbacteria bacterium]